MSLVPLLTGPNYQSWAPLMNSLLLSQGQWLVITKDSPSVGMKTETLEEGGPSITIVTNQDEVDKWEESNAKAVGNIRLCLHHSIHYKYQSINSARDIWEGLKEEYGNPGISGIYIEFKSAMDTTIPANSDPSLTIDKILAHFGRLEEAKVGLPPHIKVMILMAKIPSSMESLAQMFCQADDISKLDTGKVKRAIILSWEQRMGKGNRNQANKISAIKRGPQEPEFAQQQHESGGF